MNLSDEVLTEMAKEKDAIALWGKLHAHYVMKG